MKSSTLMDVYNAVRGVGGEEIVLGDDTITKARVCIDEMIRLGVLKFTNKSTGLEETPTLIYKGKTQ